MTESRRPTPEANLEAFLKGAAFTRFQRYFVSGGKSIVIGQNPATQEAVVLSASGLWHYGTNGEWRWQRTDYPLATSFYLEFGAGKDNPTLGIVEWLENELANRLSTRK